MQVELDGSSVALVHQPGHVGLEHYRGGEMSGNIHRSLLVGDQPGGDLRYPVTGEEISGFGRGEPASLRRAIQEGTDERPTAIGLPPSCPLISCAP